MANIEPITPSAPIRVGIVVARFNAVITEQLLAGAQRALQRQSVDEQMIDTVWVPGAIEIPLTLQLLAEKQQYAALVALGCVIRGDTAHFDYVCTECSQGVSNVSLGFDIPVGFGVLTVDNEAQAIERSGDNRDNKGLEAVNAALEMVGIKTAITALRK